MTLSTAEIADAVRDLKPRLEGGRIERMDQPEADRLVLYVRNGPALYWLLLCTHPRFGRLHLLTNRPPRGKPAGGFCNVLRDHATSAPFDGLRQVPGDRVVVIDFTARDRLMQPRRMSLVVELLGAAGNLILLDESGKMLAVNRRIESPRRTLVPGGDYSLPDPPPAGMARAEENRFAGLADPADVLALSRAIQSHYLALEVEERVSDLRNTLARALRSATKGARRRLGSVHRALEESKNAEDIRRQGELLKIALPNVEPRSTQVVVEDFFDPGLPRVTIELNPALSPEENIEWLFRRYKKAKAGAERLAERARQTAAQLEGLEALEGRVDAANSEVELRELEHEMSALGVSTGPRVPRRTPGAGEGDRGPRVFHAADGTEILVARSRRENERLTLTIARGDDYWLHLADWPGPHVVVRAPNGEVSEGALLDAAHLTVYFSKLRGADQADVVYTQCKKVRRVKGGGPGRVTHSGAKTLRVRMEAHRLKRLLAPPGPGATSA